MSADVALVVNCYERTWRQVLAPGYFRDIESQNRFAFSERVLLINNVRDQDAVIAAARDAVARHDIHRFLLVADYIGPALKAARLSPRALGQHSYFLDWGLVLPFATGCEWLLGWDAEVSLEHPHDWISPALNYMNAHPEVFSASPSWPERGEPGGSIRRESFDVNGPFALNWGFSDQAFLVRRRELLNVKYRSFAPAAYCRLGNKDHPGSFEARVEAYQRSTRRSRATYLDARYRHNDAVGDVMNRVGKSGRDRIRSLSLGLVERVLWRLRTPLRHYPRFRLP